jgi:AcrR family transcriptional regulator
MDQSFDLNWGREVQHDEDVRSNGHAARSAETRARLIRVAIEMFGDGSFEAVSTRQLAGKADVGLAAIAYHFGGKTELFDAAVESISDYCRVLTQSVAERLGADAPAGPAERLVRATSAYFEVLFGGDEPQSWVNFLVRCAADAPDAYDKLYEAAFGPLEAALTVNLAAHLGVSPRNEEVRLRACIVTNTIVSMRTNRASFLRHLGWERLGGSQIERLDRIVASLVSSDFMLGRGTVK